MKNILVYSGKGGVGKTTITISIAKYLAETNKVLLLDLDVNTPSIPTIFPKQLVNNSKNEQNLTCESIGYKKTSIIVSNTVINSYFNHIKNLIKTNKFDYIIIDTPPSLNDIHQKILKFINIQAVIYVTQATKLSYTDVEKTSDFFINNFNKPIGLIRNMICEEMSDELPDNLKKIVYGNTLDIPLQTNSIENIFKDSNFQAFIKNGLNIIDGNLSDLFKNFDIDIIPNIYKSDKDKKLKDYISNTKPNQLKFIDLVSWEKIRETIINYQSDYLPNVDNFLIHNDTNQISKIINHLNANGGEAYFRIGRPLLVNNIISFYGEIVSGKLNNEPTSYYNIPTIKLDFNGEKIVAFPHELTPITWKQLQIELSDCYFQAGNRFFPDPLNMYILYKSFERDFDITKNNKWIKEWARLMEWTEEELLESIPDEYQELKKGVSLSFNEIKLKE